MIKRRDFLSVGLALPLVACMSNGNYAEPDALARSKRSDVFGRYPDAGKLAKDAYAHLVIPNVRKASFGLGGSYGKGVVFQKDQITDHFQMTAVSGGFQAGLGSFTLVLFFMTHEAYARFQKLLGAEFGADLEYILPNRSTSIGASSASRNPVYALVANQSGIMAGVSVEGAVYTRY